MPVLRQLFSQSEQLLHQMVKMIEKNERDVSVSHSRYCSAEQSAHYNGSYPRHFQEAMHKFQAGQWAAGTEVIVSVTYCHISFHEGTNVIHCSVCKEMNAAACY